MGENSPVMAVYWRKGRKESEQFNNTDTAVWFLVEGIFSGMGAPDSITDLDGNVLLRTEEVLDRYEEFHP